MLKQSLLFSGLFLSVSAFAQGGYAGLSVGQADVDVAGIDDANTGTLLVGYKQSDNLSFEAGYTYFGEFNDSYFSDYAVEIGGLHFSAIGSLPVNESVSLFAKGGMLLWTADVTENGRQVANTEDGNDLLIGFGISAQLNPRLSVVGEYQTVDINEADVSNLSIGARYHF